MNVKMSDSEQKEYQRKKKNGIILGISIGAMIFFFMIPWGGFMTESQIEQHVEQKVISDSIKQFNIAMRTENYMDAYIQAGNVTATYLQAEDETAYLKWKEIEKKLERKLGMSY